MKMEKSFRNQSPKKSHYVSPYLQAYVINSNFTALFCATENCKQVIKTKEKTAKTA